ncbi:MAG: ATP-binding protein [Paracoccaceae bacterium]|nr:ATP-binding protein [Paracoccaceae bacterium]MDP7185113.1 ATP-binding protein [Paracoccaceae bacterium]
MPSPAPGRSAPVLVASVGNGSLLFTGQLRAEFCAVAPLLRKLTDWLAQNAVPAERQADIEIAMAEALNNVVEHGGLRPRQKIEVLARVTGAGVRIAIIDRGRAYPKGTVPESASPNFAELPEGGFGWMLIHTLTQTLRYHRSAGTNILTLEFDRQ